MCRFNFNSISLMFYIGTIILILRKFPTRVSYKIGEKSPFIRHISRHVPSHSLSRLPANLERASKSAHVSTRREFFNSRSSRAGVSLSRVRPILSFVAVIGSFPLSASKCMPPFVLHPLSSLSISLLKCARAIWQAVKTSRPGHSQVAARRGHVHAPYNIAWIGGGCRPKG